MWQGRLRFLWFFYFGDGTTVTGTLNVLITDELISRMRSHSHLHDISHLGGTHHNSVFCLNVLVFYMLEHNFSYEWRN